MYVQRIDHVQLAMPANQESQARAFYRGVLGLPEKPKPANLAKRGGVWFEQDSVKVHLGVETDFRPAKKAHPAFEVKDLTELVEKCKAFGCDIAEGEPLADYHRVFVYDPFGNRLEFMAPQQ